MRKKLSILLLIAMVVGITIGGPFLSADSKDITILGYEDQIIETAKNILTIPNANDIHGNITLPTKLNFQ